MKARLAVTVGDPRGIGPEIVTKALADLRVGERCDILVVGPEGGWTGEELVMARGAGATVVSLGEGVLRTETAAVAAAVIVLARYGRLG